MAGGQARRRLALVNGNVLGAGGDLERLSAEAKQEASLLSSLYVRYISLP